MDEKRDEIMPEMSEISDISKDNTIDESKQEYRKLLIFASQKFGGNDQEYYEERVQ